MHVRFTRISTADQPIDRATIVAEEMLGWLRDMEGFRGLLTLSREGTTLGLTFWESRELSDSHLPTRMEFLGRMTSMADVQVEESDDYELTFAYLGAGRRRGDGRRALNLASTISSTFRVGVRGPRAVGRTRAAESPGAACGHGRGCGVRPGRGCGVRPRHL